MASLLTKLTQFANSPRGRQTIQQLTVKGQQLARDPRTRAKLEDVARRIQGGRRGPGPR
jgi:hypothetical protein